MPTEPCAFCVPPTPVASLTSSFSLPPATPSAAQQALLPQDLCTCHFLCRSHSFPRHPQGSVFTFLQVLPKWRYSVRAPRPIAPSTAALPRALPPTPGLFIPALSAAMLYILGFLWPVVPLTRVPARPRQALRGRSAKCPQPHPLLSPQHVFCEECVCLWLDRERTCPLCRSVAVDTLRCWKDGATSAHFQVY